MKYQYAFILGHSWAVSAVEIIKVLEFRKIYFKELFSNEEFLLCEGNSAWPIQELQQQLGGTIKVIQIESLANENNLLAEVEKVILNRLAFLAETKTEKTKWQYGFSVYGSAWLKKLDRFGLDLKKSLKKNYPSVRFVSSKEKSLASVIVVKEHLLEQGIDLAILKTPQGYYLGRALTIQDYGDYGFRDFGRPSRDDKSGMLPPKLAKMMINLAGTGLTGKLLDPSCGSGTILQEALLLGYEKVIGTDLSPKAVADSLNNLKWLAAKYKLDLSEVKVFQADSRILSSKIEAGSIEAIITEPYLGEALKSKVQNQNLAVLADLYLKSFQEFHKILKPSGKVVFILPIIQGFKINLLETIIKIGFKQEKLSQNDRGSVVYERAGQRVVREIFLFSKL